MTEHGVYPTANHAVESQEERKLDREWIGDVGREVIRTHLNELADGSEAQVALDKFEREDLYAVIRSVQADHELSKDIEFLIPNQFHNGAPSDLNVKWFAGDAGGVRNMTASDGKRLIVTAIGEEEARSLTDTLEHVAKIDKDTFLTKAAAEFWFDRFVRGDSAEPSQQIAFGEDVQTAKAGLAGFLRAKPTSLNLAASYLREVRRIIVDGSTVIEAFGRALPMLDLPTDAGFFRSIKNPTDVTFWERAFNQLYRERRSIISGYYPEDNMLTSETLRENLESLKSKIGEEYPTLLDLFAVAADNPGDREAMRPLLFHDWEEEFVGIFLTAKPKREKKSLSESTRDRLTRKLASQTDDERRKYEEAMSYLDGLKMRESQKKVLSTVGDEEFFNKQWDNIRDDEVLVRRWEKFIYPPAGECSDFAAGLLNAVIALFAPDMMKDCEVIQKARRIRIDFQAKQHRSFTEKLSPQMMHFFGILYRDLREQLGDSVIWKTNYGKNSPDPLIDWDGWVQGEKIEANSSCKRDDAWQLRFVVTEADENDLPIGDRKCTLVWRFADFSLPCRLADFVKSLCKAPIQQMRTRPANDIGKGGVFREITLTRVDTLSKGAPETVDIDKIIRGELHIRQGELSPAFCDAYETFTNVYGKAVKSLNSEGFNYSSAAAVQKAYEALLREASVLPESEKNRTRIVGPLTAIGILRCEVGDSSFEVIPPWHPMRMFEIARQHLETVKAIKRILAGDRSIQIGREFPNTLAQEADEPSMPPMAVSLDDDLVTGGVPAFPVEHCHWFTLCTRETDNSTSQMRTDTASIAKAINEFTDALDFYEEIEAVAGSDTKPLDDTKLLIVEADGAEAAPLLRKNLRKKLETGRNIELTLQNENPTIAARIFNTLTGTSNEEPESSLTPLASFRPKVSDVSLNHLLNSYSSSEASSVRPFHLALVNMLGTKQAIFKWEPVNWANTIDADIAKPTLVDCRKYDFGEETLSQVLLVRPELTACSSLFLRHAFRVCDKAKASVAYDPHEIRLPVREIRTEQSTNNLLGQMLITAHKLADWVVTCDNMLTKNQIAHDQKLIIRSKRGSYPNFSSVISSSSSALSLFEMLRDRLDELGAGKNQPNTKKVLQRLFDEALSISGYVGLRAAKRPEFAGELIGLCLSKAIVSDMFNRECDRLGEKQHFQAFLMLDDYASWFSGQSTDRSIADIISLSFATKPSGEASLHLIITESKYCKNLDEQQKSRVQLENTLRKFIGFLARKPGGPEASLSLRVWLSRFANMILDADLENLSVDTDTFYDDLSRIRNGQISVTLNGYSHYFSFTEKESQEPVPYRMSDITYYQQVFGADDIIALLKNLTKQTSVTELVYAGSSDASNAYRFNPLPLMHPENVLFDKGNPEAKTKAVTKNKSAEVPISTKTLVKTNIGSLTQRHLSESNLAREDLALNENVPVGEYGPMMTALIARKAQPLRYSKQRLDWCDQQAMQLRGGLRENGISVKEITHIPTPNGCLVVYEGNRFLGVSVINSLKEQLLMTRRIRIVFSEPAEGEFRVFLASPTREIISMWNMWKDREPHRNKDGTNTSLIVALKEVDGSVLYLDPMSTDNDPHTLIAGGTGSGKSVLVQMLLADIAATNPASLSKIYIIDPKGGVDYAPFKKLPHLAEPVITDLRPSSDHSSEKPTAVEVFKRLVVEMKSRYALFSKADCAKLKDYNSKNPNAKLPIIWVFHDELAQAMADKEYCKEVTQDLKELATAARAAGIFLFFIAQRPDKDAVPMQVRDNLGNRLALKLKTAASSRIALDCEGAETLLGKGHLAARINNDVIYAQCPFLSPDDLQEVVDAIIKDNCIESNKLGEHV